MPTSGERPAEEPRRVTAGDGVVLQHEIAGQGEPIVFLHGGFAGRNGFTRQRPAFADRYQLILRDLRGHNGSEPQVPPGYALDTTEVEDIRHVLDAEGIDRAHLIGHSSGGAIGFAFARAYPERVRRLVLIEPSLYALATPEVQAANRAELERAIALAEAGDEVGAVHAVYDYLLGPAWSKAARPPLLAQLAASAPLVVPHLRGLLGLGVTPDDICGLRPPTLYIGGGQTVPVYRGVFQRVAAVHPTAPRRLIESAGHAVHVQAAGEVNAAILEFLAGD